MTHTIHRGLVPAEACAAALERIMQEVRTYEGHPDEIFMWKVRGWYPHIAAAPEIEALKAFLPPADRWVENQILLRYPDDESAVMPEPHIDRLPPEAEAAGLTHGRIYGVELTDTPEGGGHTVIHPSPLEVQPAMLKTGDVLELLPDVPHSPSPNQSDRLRVAVFFRTLV